MRLPATLVGALALVAASAAWAGWIVELDNGKQLTVDGYREENGTLHLEQGGVGFTVPRARVTRMEKTTGDRGPIDARKLAPATSTATADVDESVTDEQLVKRDEKVSWRLVQRQLDRFMAEANGADKKELARLETRFRKAQVRYVAMQEKLGRVPAGSTKRTLAASRAPAVQAKPVVESGVRHAVPEPPSHTH